MAATGKITKPDQKVLNLHDKIPSEIVDELNEIFSETEFEFFYKRNPDKETMKPSKPQRETLHITGEEPGEIVAKLNDRYGDSVIEFSFTKKEK